MNPQKKMSLNEFWESVSEDENEVSKILENGLEAAYEKADYDLFVAWSFLVNSDIDNNRDERISHHEYKSWSGSVEITTEAYKQRLYCNYNTTGMLMQFQFNNICTDSGDVTSEVHKKMKPLVEDLIKKIKDKKENGSV